MAGFPQDIERPYFTSFNLVEKDYSSWFDSLFCRQRATVMYNLLSCSNLESQCLFRTLITQASECPARERQISGSVWDSQDKLWHLPWMEMTKMRWLDSTQCGCVWRGPWRGTGGEASRRELFLICSDNMKQKQTLKSESLFKFHGVCSRKFFSMILENSCIRCKD